MDSVAAQLRRELDAHVRTMSVDERFDLTAQLAEQDLAAFQAASGLPRRDAFREMASRRQTGRRPSQAVLSLLDHVPRE